jgi:lipopolysaccharide/colanic/teichoic acid biosynthesis glycosyltransferase
MLFTALAIKFDSRGPVLFRQKRYGFNNELIEVFKFRSMYVEQSDATAAKLVTKGDPRVTRVGRFIRKTSLDELPQLFNVLRGDMSLVGPRPWPVAMVERQVAEGVTYRNQVMAGWTGPAQVSKDSPKRKQATEFDLQYVEACRTLSPGRLLRYDLGLLASSVTTMLRARGLKY